MIALLGVIACAWIVARDRLVPRRRTTPEEELAGNCIALLALGLLALLVAATNPFTLLFVLPAVHVWLWLPALRKSRPPARLVLFTAGLIGPLIVLGSLAWRFGLGLDAPWYLLELLGIGYIGTVPVVLTLAGTAAAAQLAAAAAGRYAPSPGRTSAAAWARFAGRSAPSCSGSACGGPAGLQLAAGVAGLLGAGRRHRLSGLRLGDRSRLGRFRRGRRGRGRRWRRRRRDVDVPPSGLARTTCTSAGSSGR